MLFHTPLFLFLYLPIALAGYFIALKKFGQQPARLWLFAASLFFYGYWNPAYLPIIMASMAFNYAIGRKLQVNKSKPLFLFGVAANLALLFYYKYTFFFFGIPTPILPLGISFFTFQEIAYLSDSYKNQTPKKQDWISYGLFVTFFPHLVAGPIVHHAEMMPQFGRERGFKVFNLAAGLSMLALGLFKKVVIADYFDGYATPLFHAAGTRPLHMVEGWVAMLSYTFQIYFDFSGYSDMALGLAKMFGIRLPVNFFSPYKSKDIIDFWRRWHMTLSRFLRDYLYIPLGGNRKHRYFNLMATMLLGGLWHGAAWTFVIWGGLHGAFLVVNNLWNKTKIKLPGGMLLTFLCAAIAWVFFRAETLASALSILKSLTAFDTFDKSFYKTLFSRQGVLRLTFAPQRANIAVPLMVLAYFACRFLPNSIEIMRMARPCIGAPAKMKLGRIPLLWRPTMLWGVVTGIVMCVALAQVLYRPSSVFLYFQF